MSANVESMFYVGRETPWHGLGTSVENAPHSQDTIKMARLDWNVESRRIFMDGGREVEGFRANVRTNDESILGIVTDRYQIVQNEDAFAFTDELLGQGVKYETAGSLQGGRRTWMLARMPENIIIAEDEVTPYFVLMNSHDGSVAIKAAMTPIRVVCQNTLNLALSTAKRTWATKHVGDMRDKLEIARETLMFANTYMNNLKQSVENLNKIKLTDSKVKEYVNEFFPITGDMSDLQKKRNHDLQDELKKRYYDAPDLQHVGNNAYRFINAVSDMATHAVPKRSTSNYKENLFLRTVAGNAMIDKAYKMIKTA